MSLFGSMDVSASGMTAETLRMDVIAENLANADSTRSANGQPYQRQEVVLQANGGSSFAAALGQARSTAESGVEVVGVVPDPSPPRRVYDPGHPDADKQGYVTLPNVNSVTEMVDLITATRGYQANVQVMNAAKQMFQQALSILR